MKLTSYAKRDEYIEEKKKIEDVKIFEDFVAFVPTEGTPFFLKSSKGYHLQLFSLKNQSICILRLRDDKKRRAVAIKGDSNDFTYSPYLDTEQKKFQLKRDLGDLLLILFFFGVSFLLDIVTLPFVFLTGGLLILVKLLVLAIERIRNRIICDFLDEDS